MPLLALPECLGVMRHRLARGVVSAVATSTCAASHCTRQRRSFYFASASYQGRSLLSASADLARTVRQAMGPDRPPHLITLFATPHAEWGAGLADMPQHVRELLTYEGATRPPVLLGGVLRSVAGGSSPSCCSLTSEGSPRVALLAAHLPGVRLMPFHTTQTSLPALPGDGWSEVVRTSREMAAATASAAAPVPAAAAAASGIGGGSVDVTAETAAAAAAAGPAAWASCRGSAPSFGAASDCDVRERQRRTSQQQLQGPHPCQLHRQQQQHAGPLGALGANPLGGLGGGGQPMVAAPSSVAALLLSTPHFVEVEELLRRFGQVAPGMQVVGGVTCPAAWGDSESNWGAVWLNDRTYAQGAVGCVLQGSFQLDTIVSPGFRGAGPLLRVTQARGHSVLEVDGEPVQRPLQRAISEALNCGEFATSLKIGLGDPPMPAVTSAVGGSSSSGGGFSAPRQHQHRSAAAAATGAGAAPPPQSQQPHRPQAAAAAGVSAPPTPPPHHPQHSSQLPLPQPQSQPPLQQRQHQQPHPRPQSPPPQSPPAPQLVTRNWFFHQGPPRPVMTVQSAAPVAPGSTIQVHLQNYPAAHRHMRDRLREFAEERLPPEVAAAEGGVGALALSSSALPFFEGPDVARHLPQAAFAGGKVEGELCSTVAGQPSRLHGFTSCLVFLRPAVAAASASTTPTTNTTTEPHTGT